MQELSVKEIMDAVGGKLISGSADVTPSKIITDSRHMEKGALFIPIVGPTFNGHDFIAASFECGAAAALTQEDTEPMLGRTIVRVEDTKKALGDIARFYKKKYRVPTVAVTGSVGKTTTKDILYSVLAKKYNTVKTQGNFNNDIGLPHTVFGQEKEHDMAVLEMGQSGFGEIRYLASIALPDIAVITNIGTSHIEKLGSREGIFKAKMEITDFFQKDNVLIVNGDDDFLKTIGEKPYRVIKYGINNNDCDILAYDIKNYGIDGSLFKVCINGEEHEVRVSVAGAHNVYNALAAICVGRQYDVAMDDIISGIADFEMTAMRMETDVYGGVTVINDCYNASPDSVRASIDVLMSLEAKRKIAVLGDILEMGDFARDAHTELGVYTEASGADILVTAGENARFISDEAKCRGMSETVHFDKTRGAAEYVKSLVKEGDAVLIKASRGMKFELVTKAIEEKFK